MSIVALIPGMQGVPEIVLIVFCIILLFGARKLPELARSLGKSLGEFKRGQREGDEVATDVTDKAEVTPPDPGEETDLKP